MSDNSIDSLVGVAISETNAPEIPAEMTNSMYLSEPSSDTEQHDNFKQVDDNCTSESGLRHRRSKVTSVTSDTNEVKNEVLIEEPVCVKTTSAEELDKVIEAESPEEVEIDKQIEEQQNQENQNEDVNEDVNESEDNDEESEEEGEEEGEEEEESEEEDEEESEEEGEEEVEEDESRVRYIQAIVIKERNDDFPWQITCAASILILTYIFKLFMFLCAMTGCNCSGRCVCIP